MTDNMLIKGMPKLWTRGRTICLLILIAGQYPTALRAQTDAEQVAEESGDEKPVVKPKKPSEKGKTPVNKQTWFRSLDFDLFHYEYDRDQASTRSPNGYTTVSRQSSHSWATAYNSNFFLSLWNNDWAIRLGRRFDLSSSSTISIGHKKGEHELGGSLTYAYSASLSETSNTSSKSYSWELGPYYIRHMRFGPNLFEPEAYFGLLYRFNTSSSNGVTSGRSQTPGYYAAFGAQYLMPMTLIKQDQLYYVVAANYAYGHSEYENLNDGFKTKTTTIEHNLVIRIAGLRLIF